MWRKPRKNYTDAHGILQNKQAITAVTAGQCWLCGLGGSKKLGSLHKKTKYSGDTIPSQAFRTSFVQTTSELRCEHLSAAIDHLPYGFIFISFDQNLSLGVDILEEEEEEAV